MTNIFENGHTSTPARKKRMALWGFYGPALFLFALLMASRGLKTKICFFGLLCSHPGGNMWWTAFIIYLYLLLAALLLVYTYMGLERLVKSKRQFMFFRIILLAIPLMTALLIWLLEPQWQHKHWIWLVSLSIVSLAGLLMIETRPTKD